MSARPTAGAADWQIYIADGVAVELLEWTIKPVFIRDSKNLTVQCIPVVIQD